MRSSGGALAETLAAAAAGPYVDKVIVLERDARGFAPAARRLAAIRACARECPRTRIGSGRPRVRPDRHRLKRHRAVATRCDKLSVRYEATVLGAAVNEWL